MSRLIASRLVLLWSSSVLFFALTLQRSAETKLLMRAIDRNDVTAVERLVRQRKDATWFGERRSRNSVTLLCWYGMKRATNFFHRMDMIQMLLRNGSDPNVGSEEAPTCLFCYRHTNLKGAVRLLCKAGADPNKKDMAQLSVLYHAIQEDSPPFVVQELLQGGADPNLRVGIPRPITRWDQVYERTVVTYQTTTETTALHLAAYLGRIQAAKDLVGFNADVNAQSSIGQTPLHLAVMRKASLPIVRLLLERGARRDLKDVLGRTPLQIANLRRNFEAAKLLVR